MPGYNHPDDGPTTKQVAVFILMAIALIVLISYGANYIQNRSDGPATCYEDFPNVVSWDYRTPELLAMWSDKKLNVAECELMKTIYDERQIADRNAKIDAEIGVK